MHFGFSFRLEPDVAYVLCQLVFDCLSDNYQFKLKEERCNQLHVTFNLSKIRIVYFVIKIPCIIEVKHCNLKRNLIFLFLRQPLKNCNSCIQYPIYWILRQQGRKVSTETGSYDHTYNLTAFATFKSFVWRKNNQI